MNQFIASTVAEAGLYFTGFVADDPAGVGRRVGGEAAPQGAAVAGPDHHRRALAEVALDGDDAGRQQALAARQRGDRAVVDHQRAGRLQRAGDPLLARRLRARRRQEPGAARARLDAAQRMQVVAVGDHHAAAGGERDARRPRAWSPCRRCRPPSAASPAIASISGVISRTSARKRASACSCGSAE